MFGTGHLRYKQDGVIRFRRLISVVPVDLSVSFGKISKSGGQLIIAGLQGAEVVVQQREPFQGCTVTRSAPDVVCIDLESERSAVPSEVAVLLRWAGGGELECRLPFPARSGYFIGPDGHPLADREVVTLARLYGIRAQVIAPSLFHAYSLSGDLRAWGLDPHIQQSVWLQRQLVRNPDNARMYELDLRRLRPEIEMMLATSSKLHTQVELRFEGIPGKPPRLCVARYDLELKSTSDAIQLDKPSLNRLQPEAMENLHLELVPLFAPNALPVALQQVYTEGVPTGRWLMPEQPLAPGPWIAVGHERDWWRVRPLLCVIDGGEATASQAHELLSAIRIASTPCAP